jgi:hypothetical protein
MLTDYYRWHALEHPNDIEDEDEDFDLDALMHQADEDPEAWQEVFSDVPGN